MESTILEENVNIRKSYPKAIKVWLAIGVFMVFMQVVIGGITRLTGSGLSITKWEIVTGTLPPLNAAQWEEAFDLYKATPQYKKINEGMSMGEFKFIYFWEYFHRLWARTMGFVFAIPFFIFLSKGWLDSMLKRRLLIVVGMAAVVASFGWIMVASGLVDRPWVNAYKLTMHLSLALILFSYLLWTFFKVYQPFPQVIHSVLLKKGAVLLILVLAVQLVLGGIMSGMKAALFYPTWPDMNGAAIPAILFDASAWSVENFVNYDKTPFMSALIQTLHRSTAYLLLIMSLWYSFKAFRTQITPTFRVGIILFVSMLIIQVMLGILTVVNSKAAVPVDLGVYHQAGALILLGIVLFLNYLLRAGAKNS
jgi:cytochrome c oxidase assembly protein subunit 15